MRMDRTLCFQVCSSARLARSRRLKVFPSIPLDLRLRSPLNERPVSDHSLNVKSISTPDRPLLTLVQETWLASRSLEAQLHSEKFCLFFSFFVWKRESELK